MANIQLKSLTKRYTTDGDETISNVDLTINEGEFVVFIGPSGCGKSTMLRMIAGLEDISDGELLFNNEVVNELSPSERKVGMVFQSYALYPHMTIRENIAFGVKFNKSWKKKNIASAVEEIAHALELSNYLEHKPASLSGGQRQRVAIGRALIRKPEVFLLDEPLSNLDAALRTRMRQTIAQFHRQFKSTTIYVTHDQVEAMTLADKVVILNNGGIEQVGTPLELFNLPNTEFVAEFIGMPKMNLIPINVCSSGISIGGYTLNCPQFPEALAKGNAKIGLRPEAFILSKDGNLEGELTNIEYLGSETILFLSIPDIDKDVVVRTSHSVSFSFGQKVKIEPDLSQAHYFVNGVRIS